MKKPEMSVVRFEESDVICASFIRVWNTNNGERHDMRVTLGSSKESGVEIYSNREPGAYDNIAAYFDPVPNTNQFNFQNGTNYHDQEWLQSSDSQGEAQDYDGLYRYDGYGSFTRISQ